MNSGGLAGDMLLDLLRIATRRICNYLAHSNDHTDT